MPPPQPAQGRMTGGGWHTGGAWLPPRGCWDAGMRPREVWPHATRFLALTSRPRRAGRHLGGHEPWQPCFNVRALRLALCQLLLAARLSALASAPASAPAGATGAATLAARAALAAPGAAAPTAPSRAAVDGAAALAVAHPHSHRHRSLRLHRLHCHHALRGMAGSKERERPHTPTYLPTYLPTSRLPRG